MRVLVATTAGAGHFAPLVPFARAVAAAGHEVRVAAPASFAAPITRAGLTHAPFDDAAPEAIGAVFARLPELAMREANRVVIRDVFGGLDLEAALPGLRVLVDGWRPDVILREPAELASYVVATERGIPYIEVNIGLDSFRDVLVELLDEPLTRLGCEAGATGLQEAPRWTLLPESFDVGSTLTTGSPARFRAGGPAAGTDLPPWWDAGDDPLVYVTFGSVAAGLGLFPRFYADVLGSLGEVDARVLMTLGEAGAPEELGTLPDNVHVERWWPQDQVMPHARAIVGHGGFGTTMAALVAGVPQVVVPLFSADQFANADQVAAVRAGVALKVEDAANRLAGSMLPAGPDVLDRLPEAVHAALHDPGLRGGAGAVAAEIAGLPEAAESVTLLEELHAERS